ncbi:MAG: carbohydrate binding domain-containing protein [Flavobacteriales bacterium]
MKHFTLIAFAALMALPMQAKIVFESGFEDWSNNLPTDWFGTRTNLAAAGVAQVSDDVNGGSFAVRLTRDVTGHQRFSTQDVAVVDGQAYEVNFWVRGEGQIRLGLYDGRPTGSGYATYTPYTNVSGNTWTEVTLNITAANSAADGQFILSVQNTVAPEHLVVDDVTISLGSVNPTETVSIQEIQETNNPDGSSLLLGSTVNTGGIVTANLPNGFYIQNGNGPWSGIFVFSTLNVPARGDSVTFSAAVEEFFGTTQLTQVNDFTVVSSGNPQLVTNVSTAQVNTEDMESVVVRVSDATCTNPNAGFGQFVVNDGSGTCLVDDVIYAFNATLNTAYNVTGPVQYAFEEYRILPRDASDVEISTGLNESAFAGVQLYPNPSIDLITLTGIQDRTEFMLSDAVGREVLTGILVNERNTISVQDLPAGLYVITLRNAGAQWSTRLAVQR